MKLPLKFSAGVKVSPASRTFTSAIAPLALHTPVAALYVEVTAPEVAVLKLPAAALDNVKLAVTAGLSTSLTTMSVRFSGVSSVYVSAALRFVAVGGSLTAMPVTALLPVMAAATPSLTLVASVKLPLN